MATSRLSKNAEIKITDSLVKVAELVNSGESPNEAIAKTAASAGIPVGHIDLMVRAYNTGRSESQRHSGSDPMEKLADFEIADASLVIELMYPSSVKSAGSILKSIEVSPVYDRRPSHEVNKLKPLSKIAYDYKSQTPLKKDDSGTFKNISSTIEKMGRDLESIRADASSYKDKMIQGITKLSNYNSSTREKIIYGELVSFYNADSTILLQFVMNYQNGLTSGMGRINGKTFILNIENSTINICNSYQNVAVVFDLFSGEEDIDS